MHPLDFLTCIRNLRNALEISAISQDFRLIKAVKISGSVWRQNVIFPASLQTQPESCIIPSDIVFEYVVVKILKVRV